MSQKSSATHTGGTREASLRYSPRHAQARFRRQQGSQRPGRAQLRGKYWKYWKVGVREFRLQGSLSYATSPYANLLSALSGL
jgi:hypothetical protein